MKIKFEIEIINCLQCPFFRTTAGCYSVRECCDGTQEQRLEKFEGMIMQESKLPCEIRTCPFEVKQ